MYEQALKLRKIMEQKKSSSKPNKNLWVYCVASGKGGVGKTNLSVNLGLALQNLGKKVLLIDADLGLANIDVVTGLYPKYNLSHVLSIGKSIQDIIVDGPKGISVLPGASGLYELANITNAQLEILIESFKSISGDFDIIIIDTSAGISKNVIGFIQSADEVIVVTTPEPSSVTDAYALIKVAHKHCDKINLIVNKTENYKEAQFTMEKLTKAAKKFLNIDINYLGFILEDKSIHKANMEQIPFFIKYPEGLASKCLINITSKLVYGQQSSIENRVTVDGWFKKLISFIKTNVGAM
ncbi:MinD/ParA family protein [Tepidanaerobacter sp. GT38]|uniref:MinD/ParA family protein n=1 Tax=Tepidanaerobacter sp. GT38 TaxID=2722793 RepID=UPI001F257D6F|nr:MinD/ParA family protein [Tepidanaerobacter sp. GT38]MCG1011731.1 MinD/ParA family protein [Tepidanaerobacter sp. GT38]